MLKRLSPLLIVLIATSVAHAQTSGGGMGGGGGHRGGGGNKGGGSGPSKPAVSNAPPPKAVTPVNQLRFVGVIKAIDVQAGRITIAYEPVETINWPAGTQPFPVGKTALLSVATVGQKVSFNIDSGEISALKPFDPPPSP